MNNKKVFRKAVSGRRTSDEAYRDAAEPVQQRPDSCPPCESEDSPTIRLPSGRTILKSALPQVSDDQVLEVLLAVLAERSLPVLRGLQERRLRQRF